MRRVPIGATALTLIFVLSTLLITPYLAPIAPQRAQFETLLAQQFGLHVEILGEIDYRFLPNAEIQLENVQLRSHAASDSGLKVAASIRSLRVGSTIWDILHRRPRVTGLAVDGMRLRLAAPPGQTEELQQFLTRLPAPLVQLSNSDIALSGLPLISPEGVLTLTNLSAVARQPNPDELLTSFDVQLAGLLALPQADQPNRSDRFSLSLNLGQNAVQKRMDVLALRLQLALGNTNRIDFNGNIRSTPKAEIEGEVQAQLGAVFTHALAQAGYRAEPALGAINQISGLVKLDSNELRSENLQIQTLRHRFQSQIRIPVANPGEGRMALRLTVQDLNLNQIYDGLQPVDKLPEIGPTGRLFANLMPMAADVAFIAQRFRLAGENGRRLRGIARIGAQGIVFERFSADLPFSTELLASGALTRADGQAAFRGEMSASSSDSLAMMIWLGQMAGFDPTALVEAFDREGWQRTGLAGDIVWQNNNLEFSNFEARLGRNQLSGEISVETANMLRSRLALKADTLNLEDWGLVSEKGNTQSPDWFRSLDIDRSLAFLLAGPEPARDIAFDLSIGTVKVANRPVGPAGLTGRLLGSQLVLERLVFSPSPDSAVSVAARLEHDGKQAFGDVTLNLAGNDFDLLLGSSLAGWQPFDIDLPSQAALQARLVLSAPDDADWPNVRMNVEGRIGNIDTGFSLETPSRQFDFMVSGSEAQLTLDGRANDMAALLGLPTQYRAVHEGRMELTHNVLAAPTGQLKLGLVLDKDVLDISGTMRPEGESRRLDGQMAFQLANFRPFFSTEKPIGEKMPLSGAAQIVVSDTLFSFSNFEAQSGSGQFAGEGVLQRADAKQAGPRPQLNAKLTVNAFDAKDLFPDFDKNTGWPDTPVNWGLLGRLDADIDIAVTDLSLPYFSLDEASGRLRLIDSVMEMSDLAWSQDGGVGTVNMQAEGGELTPSFQISASFDRVDAAQLLVPHYGQAPVVAPLTGRVDLRGRGRSVASMVQSLTGEATLEAAEGRLSFIDLDAMAEALLVSDGAAGSDGAASPDFDGGVEKGFFEGNQTRFQRGLAQIRVSKGRAEAQSVEFVFPPPRRAGRLNGSLDMMTGNLQVALQLFPRQTNQPLVYRLGGRVANPKIIRDASALTKSAQAAPLPAGNVQALP